MRLTIPRDDLLSALEGPARMAAKGANIIPILSHLRLTANGDLRVSACNLEAAMDCAVPAKIEAEGDLCVPAGHVAQLVRGFSAGSDIAIETTDKNRVRIKSGRSRYEVAILPAKDFPPFLPPEEGQTEFVLSGPEIVRLFGTTVAAVSDAKDRIYLHGVFLSVVGRMLRAEASNSFLYLSAQIPAPIGCERMPTHGTQGRTRSGVIVHGATCSEIIRLFVKTGCDFRVSADKISVSGGGARLTAKLVDSTFPFDSLEHILSSGRKHVLTADTKELSAAVERVVRFADTQGRGVKLSWAEGLLTLSSKDAAVGNGEERVAIESDIDGEYGLNGETLLTLLSATSGETVEMWAGDRLAPAVFRDPFDKDFTGLVTAMRV